MFMQYNQRKGLSNNYIKLRRDFPISTDAELPNQTNQAKSKMKYWDELDERATDAANE